VHYSTLCRELSSYLDGREVRQKTHKLCGVELRRPLVRPVLAETVAVPLGRATRYSVVLGEDGCTDSAAVSLQYDVVYRRTDVVVVIVQIQRERQK